VVEGILLRDPSQPDAPATTLETVVILTADDDVSSDYTTPEQVADADAVIEALSEIGSTENLPPSLAEGYEAPAVMEEDIPELFTANNHDFRVSTSISNSACATDFFFDGLAYTVDAFASAEDVAAVLADESFNAMNEALGFGTVEEPVPGALYFVSDAGDGCSDEGAVTARTYLPRGRYLATVEVSVPPELLDQMARQLPNQEGVAVFLAQQVTRIFELGLAEAYRPLPE
jgi:hypothetical protein